MSPAVGRVSWISLLATTTYLIFFCFLPVHSSQCHARCSPHFTLPCSFGAFDKCIEQNCKELCRKDGGRSMAACYCRGTVEGPTMRACFCGPSAHKKSSVKFF